MQLWQVLWVQYVSFFATIQLLGCGKWAVSEYRGVLHVDRGFMQPACWFTGQHVDVLDL